jgi:hypothetical protein
VSSTNHYGAAEHLLEAKNPGNDIPVHPLTRLGHNQPVMRPPTPQEIAQAQAHATLALVNVAEKLLAELVALRQHLSGS